MSIGSEEKTVINSDNNVEVKVPAKPRAHRSKKQVGAENVNSTETKAVAEPEKAPAQAAELPAKSTQTGE